MISDRDFVVLSDDWDGLPTSAIHLFRRLAQRNRVFWFNTLTRLPRPRLADARKVARAVGNWLRPARPSIVQESDVTVVSPFMVPWFRRPFRRLNRASLMGTYRRLQRRHDIRDPIVVTTFPCAVDFVRAVEAPCKLYYCVDDFADYPGIDRRAWAEMETELLACCDALAVVSPELARTRHLLGPVLDLPHGVDFDHYQKPRYEYRPIPALDDLPRPLVGFFGLIGAWIDLDLVLDLARSFPHVSFALVGRSERDLSCLAGQKNVHHLGWVHYADLPHYGARFDVGLVPYDPRDPRIKTVNPLKLMEYFALGLPVLALSLPALEDVHGPLHLARTHEEFRAGLAAILDAGPGGCAEDARAVARANTWEARAGELGEFLQSVLCSAPPYEEVMPCARSST